MTKYKRMRRREHPEAARFLTFSCEQRRPLLSTPQVRDWFVAHLARTQRDSDLRLFAWVVMPEHVHLLVRPPTHTPLSRILGELKGRFAHQLMRWYTKVNSSELDHINRISLRGSRYDRLIYLTGSTSEFTEKIRYIHQNPVARGLARTPADWRWSSAGWPPDEPPPIDRRWRD